MQILSIFWHNTIFLGDLLDPVSSLVYFLPERFVEKVLDLVTKFLTLVLPAKQLFFFELDRITNSGKLPSLSYDAPGFLFPQFKKYISGLYLLILFFFSFKD